MNSEIKKLWCEKLRSNEYEQGKGSLRQEGNEENGGYTFCCLGVLCDLSRSKSEIKGEWYETEFNTKDTIVLEFAGLLPYSVAKWAGVQEYYVHQPTNTPMCQQSTLAKLNDDGATFSRIADYIEANL